MYDGDEYPILLTRKLTTNLLLFYVLSKYN